MVGIVWLVKLIKLRPKLRYKSLLAIISTNSGIKIIGQCTLLQSKPNQQKILSLKNLKYKIRKCQLFSNLITLNLPIKCEKIRKKTGIIEIKINSKAKTDNKKALSQL